MYAEDFEFGMSVVVYPLCNLKRSPNHCKTSKHCTSRGLQCTDMVLVILPALVHITRVTLIKPKDKRYIFFTVTEAL